MKKIGFLLLALFSLMSCQDDSDKLSTDLINITPTADNNRSSKELPQITFVDTVHNFGKILEGETVIYSYHFENTGAADLLLTDVQTSCGCTTIQEWKKKPYKPGEKGELKIQFDSDKKPGKNKKTISVLCNTYPSVHRLYMEGEVIGPK